MTSHCSIDQELPLWLFQPVHIILLGMLNDNRKTGYWFINR